MKNKYIKINGVDVSKCPYFLLVDEDNLDTYTCSFNSHEWTNDYDKCENFKNCQFKKLKKKEIQYEKLKEKYEVLKLKNLKKIDENERLQIDINQYKQIILDLKRKINTLERG